MKQARSFLAAAAVTLLAGPAIALASGSQAPHMPVRIRATIEKFDHHILTVSTEKGVELNLEVTPNTNISGVDARKLSDIKAKDFIGVAAMEGPDAKLHATEIHIFPEAMRGAGEGHFPANKGPGSSMTNAAVVDMADAPDGKIFTLLYRDGIGRAGSTDIDIGPNTPIVAFVPGDPSLLKPGAHAVIFVRKDEDRDLVALGIVAEKDGVQPPM
jgi:hypothetical protein